MLKKIKSLEIEQNGGFPVILSAMTASSTGEILMTYSGSNIYDEFDIRASLDDALQHKSLTHKQLSTMGMQLVSQLEILHKLGYTHGDIKF